MLAKVRQLTFAPYYGSYLEHVKFDNPVQELDDSADEFSALILEVPKDKWQYRYALEKWTVAQVVHHVIESEIIFAYRALTIAREAAEVNLPGFDENQYAAAAHLKNANGDFLHRYFLSVRNSTRAMLDTLSSEQLHKKGTANGQRIEVEALFFIAAGHCRHHMRVLSERYL